MSEFADRFPLALDVIETGMRDGLHIGAQFYISQNGQTLADFAIGEARPGLPMAGNAIMLWLSACKPITAIAIAKLYEARKLSLNDPVSNHIPEFIGGGKEAITIEHLLTHTGGIRWADYALSDPWQRIIARICAAKVEPRWIVGQTAGYHLHTSWFILGEIIRRLTGVEFTHFIRENIFDPLEMADCFYSLNPAKFESLEPRRGKLISTDSKHTRAVDFDSKEHSHLIIPGASCRGPIRLLGRFYQMLLRGGENVISPETVKTFTARRRIGQMDLTFKRIIDWGLGFICNSARYGQAMLPYGFGPYASDGSFGHGGSQSSIGMVDPANKLVIAIVFNGMAGEVAHEKRNHLVLRAIYEDLGLARDPA